MGRHRAIRGVIYRSAIRAFAAIEQHDVVVASLHQGGGGGGGIVPQSNIGFPTKIAVLAVRFEAEGHVAVRNHSEASSIACREVVAGEVHNQLVRVFEVTFIDLQVVVVDKQIVERDLDALCVESGRLDQVEQVRLVVLVHGHPVVVVVGVFLRSHDVRAA